MSRPIEDQQLFPLAEYPPEMSNYLLQSAASASGHVINWTYLPGFVVGYQDISSTIIPGAYPLGNQRIEKSFSKISVPTAKTSVFVPDIRHQTPPVNTDAGNWRTRRKRWRKRKRQDRDTGFLAVPTNSSDNPDDRCENTGLEEESGTEHAISEKFYGESIEVDAIREGRTHSRLFEETRYCRTCRATFNAPAQARQHYSGRLHKRMVKLFSDDCSSSSTTTQERAPVTCPGASGTGSGISVSVYCALCSVAFNSDKQAVQHYAGKIHAKRLRADDVIYTYTKNGYVTRRCQEKRKLRQTKGQRLLPAEGFVCIVCGAQMTSQCRMKRHLKNRHRLHRIPLEFKSIY